VVRAIRVAGAVRAIRAAGAVRAIRAAGAVRAIRAAGAAWAIRAVGAIRVAGAAVDAAAIVAGVMRVLLKMKEDAAIGADVLPAPRHLRVLRAD
jgi:hypothetical protein